MKKAILLGALTAALVLPALPSSAVHKFCVVVPKLGLSGSDWVAECTISGAPAGLYAYAAAAYNDWEILVDGSTTTNLLGKPTWQLQARYRYQPNVIAEQAGREAGAFMVLSGSHTITARLKGGCGPIPPVGTPVTQACGSAVSIVVWHAGGL